MDVDKYKNLPNIVEKYSKNLLASNIVGVADKLY